MEVRLCTMCRIEKSIENFYESGKRKSRLNKRCADCIRESHNPNSDAFKRCTTCAEIKSFDQFWNETNTPSRKRGMCRDCSLERARNANDIYKTWLDAFKDNPCTDCGRRYPPHIMHWDHLPGTKKVTSIGRLKSARAKKEVVLEELAKCELVCANCHANRTYERKDYFRTND